MFGNHYYHARIRKAVASFGRIFNDIYIIRKKSDGTVLQTMKVPIAYAPRSKYLERIRENQSLEPSVHHRLNSKNSVLNFD